MVHEDSDAAEDNEVKEMPAKDLVEEVAGGNAAKGGEVEVVRSDSTEEEEVVLP